MGNCNCGEKKKRPDMNYNFLIKKEEKKDGLDVYRPQTTIFSFSEIKCPLCKCDLPEEENQIIEKKLSFYRENKLSKLIDYYNTEANAEDKIDNISDLEDIYNQIKDYSQEIENNRYYKHTCTNNELCQRMNNQEIYLDLCSFDINNFQSSLIVDINRLKTDENYKNNYLNKKAVAYNKYIKKQRKIEIENKYRDEFEQYTFEKEKYEYEKDTMAIRHTYEMHLAQNKLFDPPDDNPYLKPLDNKPDPSFYWYSYKDYFKYSWSRKKLKSFIEDLTGEKMYDACIVMESWEYEEFVDYILKREPEYYELLNIK